MLGGGWMDEKRRRISMTVSIKLLHFFSLLPSSVNSPGGPEGGIMFGEIAPHLRGFAPPSNEICDRAEPRHLQLLSSSLYLPRFVLLPARLPTATAGPGLINISESRWGWGASTVAANRFRAGAHRAECKVLPRLLSAAMLHSEGRYLLTCVAHSGKEGNRACWVQCGWTPTVPALLRQRDPVRSIYFLAAHKPQKGSVVL